MKATPIHVSFNMIYTTNRIIMKYKCLWIYSALFSICVIFTSSSKKNSMLVAYPHATNNQHELEKVLMYFKNNADSLKYESALFLIQNMPYNFSIYGDNIEEYEKACKEIASMPKELRTQEYFQLSKNIDKSTWKAIPDIQTINADFLTKYVNETVDNWRKQTWSKEYSKNDFFNYVLPYRIANETLSNWHRTIDTEYPYLNKNCFWSNHGIRYDYSQAILSNNSESTHEMGAVKGVAMSLNTPNAKVTFKLSTDIPTDKLINLQYSSKSDSTKIFIYLNGNVIKECHLKQTASKHHFQRTHFGIPIHLKEGENELCVELLQGNMLLDFMELSTYEKLEAKNTIDFSQHLYKIKNQETGNCISLDTLSYSLLQPIELKNGWLDDKSLQLQFEYLGYPSWKISPKNDNTTCIENRWVSLEPKNELARYDYLRGNHQKWVIIPIGKELYKIINKDSGLCWESQLDKSTGKEVLVQNVYNGQSCQHWQILPTPKKPAQTTTLFHLHNAASAALKVTDVMEQFEYIASGSILPPSLSTLCKYRTGTCQEEATYVVALSRYLGIPTSIDFTPHWGNRTNSHSWSALIMPQEKSTPFYMGCAPGDTMQYFHNYLKPKVYRRQFQLNQQIATDLNLEKSKPSLFQMPKFIDVTKDYCPTTDIERTIPFGLEKHDIVYICVFDKTNWYPVDYSKVTNGKAFFKSMGRNILYSIGYWENGKIIPIANPFIVTRQGQIREIKVNHSKRQAMTLLRKYPFFGKEDFFNFRMSFGKFQGSNKPDFSDAYTFFVHDGMTEGNWCEQIINCKNTFKYLRYLSPKNSYGNINELEFYDTDGEKLHGEIIGTDGLANQGKETVFDGNVLTGFNSANPDGNWVGIKLPSPTKISKIKYMPRNDGNSIEIGDLYRLECYDGGTWKVLEEKTASENKLLFNNVPTGGLYLLKNLTKGNEERIFTYENNKQIWW